MVCMLLLLERGGVHVVLKLGKGVLPSAVSPQPLVPCVLMRQGMETSISLFFFVTATFVIRAMLDWYTIVFFFYNTVDFPLLRIFVC